MNIRRASSDDCAALTAIDAAGNPSPWSERQFLEAVENPADTVCVCERGGEICGFAVWREICGESELHLIAAAPACRRQGIASKLLAYWFQTASSQGVSRLLLEVRAGNAAAIGLYRKYGFIETGRRKNYYPLPEGGYEDAILMEKPC